MQHIELYFTKNKKYLKFGDYIKYFNDVNNIDELLNKIKNKDLKVNIYAEEADILKHKLNNDSIYNYYIIDDLPIFDEHIFDNDLSNIKLKRYKPKEEWQLQFGKEVYITNSEQVRRKIIDQDKFCFTINDLKELQKNNWQIDDAYMFRVFFGGTTLNKENT